jgi:arylsulfatase A-like enzyme
VRARDLREAAVAREQADLDDHLRRRPADLQEPLAIAAGVCVAVAEVSPRGQSPQKVAETVQAIPSERPNIILIVTDDMDLTHVPYMPHLRTDIAAKGMTFSNMFVSSPVCAPSRASILTGQYAHNHGLRDGGRVTGGYREFLNAGREKATLAVWLQAAGYRTALHGKYLNFYPLVRDRQHVPLGWDDWRGICFPERYDDYTLNENGRLVSYGAEEKDYLTDVLRDKALDFIKESPKSQPFFLYLAPFAPHAPSVPAERHEALFPDLKAPRTPAFNEEDLSDKPAWIKALPPMSDEVIAQTDELFRKRVQSMQSVDEMIDALVKALEDDGRLRNTYIVFTSDNGFHFGAHRLDHGKGDAYD